MLPGKPEVLDIEAKIRTQRLFALKELILRSVIAITLGWSVHLLFSVWHRGQWKAPWLTEFVSLGVTFLTLFTLVIPFWKRHCATVAFLKETRLRLMRSVSVPAPLPK